MRVYEYEVKRLLREKGIDVPDSGLARSHEEAADWAEKLGGPVVLKAQTLIKQRGKSGLIAFVDTPKEAAQAAWDMFGREHAGERVESVLVERKLDPQAEIYLGIVIDYALAQPVIIVSPKGGVNIEETAEENPDLIRRLPVSPSKGVTPDQARESAETVASHLPGLDRDALGEVILKLYDVFTQYDCEMIEINPLAATKEGLFALDAAFIVDDEALHLHPDLVKPRGIGEEDFKRQAVFREKGWNYLPMDGNIGVLSSGAGIAMAILDLMIAKGGRPANFLDTTAMDRQGIYDAFTLIFHDDPKIETVLVNIFAGLNRCDFLAEGIKDYLIRHEPHFNVVVRMIGNRDEEGRRMLRDIGVEPIAVLEEAVDRAIAVTEERK